MSESKQSESKRDYVSYRQKKRISLCMYTIMNGEVKLICAAYTDAYTARRKINIDRWNQLTVDVTFPMVKVI